MDSLEKRINKLVRKYAKTFGCSSEEARKMVEEEIEEDCIESVEQNMADGLMDVGHQNIGRLLR